MYSYMYICQEGGGSEPPQQRALSPYLGGLADHNEVVDHVQVPPPPDLVYRPTSTVAVFWSTMSASRTMRKPACCCAAAAALVPRGEEIPPPPPPPPPEAAAAAAGGGMVWEMATLAAEWGGVSGELIGMVGRGKVGGWMWMWVVWM